MYHTPLRMPYLLNRFNEIVEYFTFYNDDTKYNKRKRNRRTLKLLMFQL